MDFFVIYSGTVVWGCVGFLISSSPTVCTMSVGFRGLEQALAAHLTQRDARSKRRCLTTFPSSSIDFSSNSYLSLSLIPTVRQAYLEYLEKLPATLPLFGSGGSRLLDGNLPLTEDIEQQVAKFHHAPAGLLFNSGFDANVGLLSCLPSLTTSLYMMNLCMPASMMG